MSKKLKGKVALITGAGNGMGAAMTKLFVEEGAKVVAVDIMENSLDKWHDNENIISVYADIMNEDDIEKMITTAENDFGRLDIVCNVAGINDLCYTLEDTTNEMWDKVIDLDLKAPFLISRRAAKGMIERGSGVFLNIGSYAAVRGNHGPSYSAAKHGIVGLTMSMAVGLIQKGIRTNCINPGGTITNIEENSGGKYHPEGMGMLMDIAGKFPTQGYAQPEDIANAALWLCCDDSKHINGAIVPVDRGMSCC